jgi:hypothetical protein
MVEDYQLKEWICPRWTKRKVQAVVKRILSHQLQNLTIMNRAGLLEKLYSGTFYRSSTQNSVPILEFTTGEIVGFP